MKRAALQRVLRWSFALAVVWAVAGEATATEEQRVALVIGNAQYAHVSDLSNPVNDAVDIAATFGRLGFSVTLQENLSRASLTRALRDFRAATIGADNHRYCAPWATAEARKRKLGRGYAVIDAIGKALRIGSE